MQVNILEAKNRLSELIRSACAGEDVVIANRGRPVARLVAQEDLSGSGASGSAQGLLDWLGAHPLPAYASRHPDEIDAGIQEERDGWS